MCFTDDIIGNINREMSQHFDEIKRFIVDLKAKFQCTKFLSEIEKELQCVICKHVIEPPAVYANCCNKIIGCKKCITHAIATERACPHCRNQDTHGIHMDHVDRNSLMNLKRKFLRLRECRKQTMDNIHDADKQDYRCFFRYRLGPRSDAKSRS